MNLLKRFYRLLSKRQERRYYNSIEELSVYNWWKVNETEDYKYILKDGFKLNKYAPKAYEKLKDEFIDCFGIDDKYSKYLSVLCELELLKIKFAITTNRVLLTRIEIKELELEEIIKSFDPKKIKKDNTIYAVSKDMGIDIDPKKISVKRYYTYVYSIIEKNRNNA